LNTTAAIAREREQPIGVEEVGLDAPLERAFLGRRSG